MKYLVECSLKGEKPKEFQIAADVFGRKADTEKEINVRVYILNLRKKLKEYYQFEGQDDDLIFLLPKGQYNLEFQFSPIKSIKKKLFQIAPQLLVVSVLILATSLILILSPKRKIDIPFWNDYIKNDFPLYIVLGDHYFLQSELATGRNGSVRDNQINSDEDFDAFLQKNPELIGTVSKSDLTYINNQAPIGLFQFMKLFGGGIIEIQMDYSSRIKLDDFRGYHTIFIGSYKTLQSLRSTVEKLGIDYQIQNSVLNYSTADSTFIFDNRAENNLSYEYATVAYFEQPDGRKVIFFMCDSDIGNIALAKHFTNIESMKKFQKQLNKLPGKNFKAVFEVKGEQRTDFKIDLVRLDALPENLSEIWP
ncbi:hypothetical protein ACUNWD_04160 [Sunxiuqinia sp. A32]|uniref:hypothetical protein n=1 Tax=Sunxiuqinia sp. A32 TaxID=3461496 RepID=UPI0040465089